MEARFDPLQDLSLSLLQICCQMTGLALWTVAAHALLKIDTISSASVSAALLRCIYILKVQ